MPGTTESDWTCEKTMHNAGDLLFLLLEKHVGCSVIQSYHHAHAHTRHRHSEIRYTARTRVCRVCVCPRVCTWCCLCLPVISLGTLCAAMLRNAEEQPGHLTSYLCSRRQLRKTSYGSRLKARMRTKWRRKTPNSLRSRN